MNNCRALMSVVLLLSWSSQLNGSDQTEDTLAGPRFTSQAAPQPELGEEGTIELPPEPAPADGDIRRPPIPPPPSPENSGTEEFGSPADSTNPRTEAIAEIVKAQAQIGEQRYEEAIRSASRALALDPENAAAYKKVRAVGYTHLGRYEEALADSKSLEVIVTARQAELKSKRTVIGIVSQGTKVLVEDVKGDWLKVAAAGNRQYDWAWIRKRDLRSHQPPLGETGRYIPQAGYLPQPIDPAPRPRFYIYYGPADPYRNFGRDYYDYWYHVPPRYWHYLPR